MTDSKEIRRGSFRETILLPLWDRSIETVKPKPLLVGNKAVEIINDISYNFGLIS